ncbi:MAG: pyridoxamine 5'-phosphate oxidase family protein [Aquabacterium sp.]|nr:pyridoxamine 5'-phosphate oxidase family protein [Aquabacterium sp.]
MSGNELRDRIRRYLHEHHVAALATQGAQGPWAAAVFYAGDETGLYFLSSPRSRHAVNLSQHPRVSAAIQDNCTDWAEIRGVQLEGLCAELEGRDRERAQRQYAQKFPLIAHPARAPLAIAEALARVRWYRLVPDRLYLLDNSRGFGHREELTHFG